MRKKQRPSKDENETKLRRERENRNDQEKLKKIGERLGE
jgi:hypothetical protein